MISTSVAHSAICSAVPTTVTGKVRFFEICQKRIKSLVFWWFLCVVQSSAQSKTHFLNYRALQNLISWSFSLTAQICFMMISTSVVHSASMRAVSTQNAFSTIWVTRNSIFRKLPETAEITRFTMISMSVGRFLSFSRVRLKTPFVYYGSLENSIFLKMPWTAELTHWRWFWCLYYTFCLWRVTGKLDFPKLARKSQNHLFYDDFDVCITFCKS